MIQMPAYFSQNYLVAARQSGCMHFGTYIVTIRLNIMYWARNIHSLQLF